MKQSLEKFFDMPSGSDLVSHLNALDPHDKIAQSQIASFLADATVNHEDISRLRCLCDETIPPLPSYMRGVFDFKLFVTAAEETARIDVAASDKTANAQEADTRLLRSISEGFLFDFYRIPFDRYNTSSFTLHKVGTSSFILLVPELNEVLKIIKPYFLAYEHITDATAKYKTNFGAKSKFCPEVKSSGPYHIAMEYIEGRTLREYIEEVLHNPETEMSDGQKLDHVLDIIEQICHALRAVGARGKHHYDLSPANILIQSYTIETHDNVKVIDFGCNYVITERVGSSAALEEARIYIAPEMFDRPFGGHDKADIFSLGMILLHMLGTEHLRIEEITKQLDQVWRMHPSFAALVEDLIDKNPEKRLLATPKDVSPYTNVSNLLRHEIDVFKRGLEIRSKRGLWFMAIVLSGWLGATTTFVDAYAEYSERKRRLRPTDMFDARRLRFALTTELLHGVTVLAFFAFILVPPWRAWAACNIGFPCLVYRGVPLSHNWLDYFPGRLVAVSFSFIAAKYYLDIFSSITTFKNLSLPELILRACSFTPWLWIWYAMFLDPKAWPFCSAMGVGLTAINNVVIHRVFNTMQQKVSEGFEIPRSTWPAEVMDRFGEWWKGVFLYFCALVAIGILLLNGWAKDELIYAVVVAVCDLLMYLENCCKEAPKLRSVLTLLMNGGRRLVLLDH
jgi:hypothetical protein